MTVDFYFGPGSRYSYLAATQLERISAQTGAEFRWRPVLSADLVARTGGVRRTPGDPEYLTQDVTRWARHYGVPFYDLTVDADWRVWALACTAAQRVNATEPFALALYRRAYGEGRPPSGETELAELAATVGLDAAAFADALKSPATTRAYEDNLDAALAAGAFGVPTFVTEDGSLFWGQDRLPLLVDHLAGLRG